MAGFRLTLKKLAKKYGVDIEGATYAKVVQEIINENVARASKKMGNLSNRRMKQAFADSIKDGIVTLPDYAIPNVTVRKGAEDGKMITDTLRDVLTRGLRKAITDNPNDTEKAIAQMQSHIKDTFTTYTTSHAKMIAVTEVRSSVDLSKAEYVRELVARNPNKLRVTKKWIHHDHLVKIPRPTHKAIDGEKVLFNQPFSIGLMYPHDPNAPASEVIGCQCGYQVEVEEMATNEIYKELKSNIRRFAEVRKSGYPVGHISHRSDGDYEKQANGEWVKVTEKKQEKKQEKFEIPKDWKPTVEQMTQIRALSNIKDKKALMEKFAREFVEHNKRAETIYSKEQIVESEEAKKRKSKAIELVTQKDTSSNIQEFQQSIMYVTSEVIMEDQVDSYEKNWNEVCGLYGAKSYEDMTEDQYNKMSADINKVVNDYIQNNDVVVHNNLRKLIDSYDILWSEDGRLRTAEEIQKTGARSKSYMKTRTRMEDKFMPNRKILGVEGQAIYGEFCSDWKNSRASQIYDGGLHFKLKNTVKERCTSSIGDSFNAQYVFHKNIMGKDAESSFSAIRCLNIEDNKLKFEYDTKQDYVESQIWGGVGKEDIETVYLNRSLYENNKEWCDRNFAGITIELGDY